MIRWTKPMVDRSCRLAELGLSFPAIGLVLGEDFGLEPAPSGHQVRSAVRRWSKYRGRRNAVAGLSNDMRENFPEREAA